MVSKAALKSSEITQCGYRAKAYLRAKLHLDPSNCLAIHQRYMQTEETDNGPIA